MEHKYIALTMKDPNIHMWPGMGFLKYRDKANNPPEVIAINESAAEILLRCDGTRTMSEIAYELSSHYNTEHKKVLPMVMKFTKSIGSTGYLHYSDKPSKVRVIVTGSRNFSVPMHAAIEITSRCNLSCRHCYNSSGPECDEIMSLEKVLNLFSKLEEWGIRSVELTGGEPLTHSHFRDILKAAQKYFDLVGVITNGTLVDDSILEIMNTDNALSLMQIDLDGATSEYVNWFRGQDKVFERELLAIKRVVEKGILIRVAMIVTPGNLDQIEETASLVKDLGANTFGMSLVVPQGRASDSTLILSPSELEKYFKTYSKLSQQYKDFIYQDKESKFLDTGEGNCGAGSRTVTITPNGNVKICQMSDETVFCFGNVFENSSKELFEKKAESLAQIQAPSEKLCGDCKHLGFCLNCIHRGVIKAKAISPENCLWVQPYLSFFKEN